LDVCDLITNPRLKRTCETGAIYNAARQRLLTEIEEAGSEPEAYAKAMGWNLRLTPELKECIDLEISFTKGDVQKVAKTLAEVADELMEKGEATSIGDAMYLAELSDEVSDTISNIVAERLLEAIQKCKEQLY